MVFLGVFLLGGLFWCGKERPDLSTEKSGLFYRLRDGATNRDYVVIILDMLLLVGQGTRISNMKIPLIGKYFYEKRHSLDRLKDGLIEDPRVCKFDPMFSV